MLKYLSKDRLYFLEAREGILREAISISISEEALSVVDDFRHPRYLGRSAAITNIIVKWSNSGMDGHNISLSRSTYMVIKVTIPSDVLGIVEAFRSEKDLNRSAAITMIILEWSNSKNCHCHYGVIDAQDN